TTFVVTSPCASSAAAHAVISAGTVATPSSASPKHAPSSKSHSGTIWATDSSFQAPRPFPTCQKSSSPEPNCPDRHHFCPSYRHWPKAAVLQIPAAGSPAGPAWLPGGGAAGPAWPPGGGGAGPGGWLPGGAAGPAWLPGGAAGPAWLPGGGAAGPAWLPGGAAGPAWLPGGGAAGPAWLPGGAAGPAWLPGGGAAGPAWLPGGAAGPAWPVP